MASSNTAHRHVIQGSHVCLRSKAVDAAAHEPLVATVIQALDGTLSHVHDSDHPDDHAS